MLVAVILLVLLQPLIFVTFLFQNTNNFTLPLIIIISFEGYMERYLGSQNEAATKAYCDIAMDAKISPTELALSWCYHRSHVASTIIGATTIEQLNENIKAYDVILEDETLEKIAEVYKKYTDPTKAM